jgi:hypothetical protein
MSQRACRALGTEAAAGPGRPLPGCAEPAVVQLEILAAPLKHAAQHFRQQTTLELLVLKILALSRRERARIAGREVAPRPGFSLEAVAQGREGSPQPLTGLTEFGAPCRSLVDDSTRGDDMKCGKLITLVPLLGMLACTVEIAAPATGEAGVGGEQRVIVVGGIRATLALAPNDVERTYPFRAQLTLTNTTATTSTWTSGSSCLAILNLYRGAARIPLRGTDYGCLAVITTHTLAPGESKTASWDLVAQTTDGSALIPGEYVLEADPLISSRQTLRHRLIIR